MTAQQYLEQLQRVYRRYDYLLEILQDRRDLLVGKEVKKPGSQDDIPRYARELSRRTVDKLLNVIPPDLQHQAAQYLAKHLSGKGQTLGWACRAHKEFLSHASDMAKDIFTKNYDIAVGELEKASFNASVIPVPGQHLSLVIAMNQGVSALVYEIARTVAGTFNVTMGETSGAKALSDEEAAVLLHERLNYYIHLGIPYGSESEISNEQIVLASSVTTMAERFAYLHEISHIILDHHDKATLQLLPGDWSSAEHFVHPFKLEHEADLLAWQLLARLFVRRIDDLQMAYAGTSLLLKVANLLEHAEDLVAIGTHPPAISRIKYMHEAVTGTVEEVGVPFEQVAMIERAMSDRFDSVMRIAPPLPGDSPLEVVLEKASSSIVPDYMTFQTEILTLLSHSAPVKLCRALGLAMGKAEENLRKLGVITNQPPKNGEVKLSKSNLEAARKPFNKFKLVNGLMGLYLIPEIRRFVEQYRDEYLRREDD